jgi:translocation and assembly module TamA
MQIVPELCTNRERNKGARAVPRQFRSLQLAILTVFFLPAFAWSQSVEVVVRPANEDFQQRLENASLSSAAIENEDSKPEDVLAAAQSEYGIMVGVLYSRAHFAGEVSVRVDGREAADISPFERPSGIDLIQIVVSPGPQFNFGKLDVSPLAEETRFSQSFSSGEPALVDEIKSAIRTAIRGWRDLGYPQAAVADQKVVANHNLRTLDVSVKIEPGRRLRFGKLTVSGNKKVRTERVAAITGLPDGELVTPEETRDAEQRLAAAGAFRSFVLRPADASNPDDTLDFVVDVLEEKPRRLGFGAEYNSSDGIRLSAFWFHRNLTGASDRLRFNFDIIKRINERTEFEFDIGASYRRPSVITADDDFFVDLRFYQDDLDDYVETALVFGSRIERQFSEEFSASLGVSLSRSLTDFGITKRKYDIYGIPGVLTWDSRDFENDPKHGIFAKAEVMPFYGAIDADSGLRATLNARYYQAIGSDEKFVLALRGLVGTVLNGRTGTIPERMLFFSGGSETVRGHDYRSLGVDVAGRTFGGAGFLGASVEGRYWVTETLGVVVFYDYGYVSPEELGRGGGKSHSGAGIGARYATPIGPIRFDVAGPVTGDGDGIQFYLGIGQAY